MINNPHPKVDQWISFDLAVNERHGRQEAVNAKLLTTSEAEKERAWASARPVKMGDSV